MVITLNRRRLQPRRSLLTSSGAVSLQLPRTRHQACKQPEISVDLEVGPSVAKQICGGAADYPGGKAETQCGIERVFGPAKKAPAHSKGPGQQPEKNREPNQARLNQDF